MVCWWCTQVFPGEAGQVKCKVDGHVIPSTVYYSKKPCDCPLDSEEGEDEDKKS